MLECPFVVPVSFPCAARDHRGETAGTDQPERARLAVCRPL